jgi:hypothetical protein
MLEPLPIYQLSLSTAQGRGIGKWSMLEPLPIYQLSFSTAQGWGIGKWSMLEPLPIYQLSLSTAQGRGIGEWSMLEPLPIYQLTRLGRLCRWVAADGSRPVHRQPTSALPTSRWPPTGVGGITAKRSLGQRSAVCPPIPIGGKSSAAWLCVGRRSAHRFPSVARNSRLTFQVVS